MESNSTLNGVFERFNKGTIAKQWAELNEPKRLVKHSGLAAAGSFYHQRAGKVPEPGESCSSGESQPPPTSAEWRRVKSGPVLASGEHLT